MKFATLQNMKFYLAKHAEGAFIYAGEESPFCKVINGHHIDSCTGGYETEAALREGAKIPPAPCKMCHSPYATHYSNSERLLENGICFTCDVWLGYVNKRNHPQVARINGNHYWVNPVSQEKNHSFLGHAGRTFNIEWFDGRKARSNDVWHQGTIPKHFRELLPDNAKFLP